MGGANATLQNITEKLQRVRERKGRGETTTAGREGAGKKQARRGKEEEKFVFIITTDAYHVHSTITVLGQAIQQLLDNETWTSFTRKHTIMRQVYLVRKDLCTAILPLCRLPKSAVSPNGRKKPAKK